MSSPAARIVRRFLAAIEDATVLAILEKIRKRATSGLNMKQVDLAVKALGGSIEKEIVWGLAQSGYAGNRWRDKDDGPVRGSTVDYEAVVRSQATSLPPNPKHRQVVWMNVGPKGDGYGIFEAEAWVGTLALKVRAPDGKEGIVKGMPYGDATPGDVLKWLNEETDFYARVVEAVGRGTPGEEREHRKREQELSRSNVGTCPCCGRFMKLDGAQRMVLHGYQRPGEGFIMGRCFGVKYPPYELSDAGCKAYKKYLEERMEALERMIAALPDQTQIPNPKNQWAPYIKGQLSPRVWERVMEREESRLRGAAKGTLEEVQRMNSMIAKWTLRPLPHASL